MKEDWNCPPCHNHKQHHHSAVKEEDTSKITSWLLHLYGIFRNSSNSLQTWEFPLRTYYSKFYFHLNSISLVMHVAKLSILQSKNPSELSMMIIPQSIQILFPFRFPSLYQQPKGGYILIQEFKPHFHNRGQVFSLNVFFFFLDE